MKTANMEAGNRHLGRSASVLFGGSTPSLLNSTPNNNGSLACLVNPGKEKRLQRHSPAAELVSDFVWQTFLKAGGAQTNSRVVHRKVKPFVHIDDFSFSFLLCGYGLPEIFDDCVTILYDDPKIMVQDLNQLFTRNQWLWYELTSKCLLHIDLEHSNLAKACCTISCNHSLSYTINSR